MHVLLLIYWSVVIYGLQAALMVVLMRGLTLLGVEGFAFFSDGDLGQRIVDVFRSLFWPDQDREGLKVAPVMWSALFSLSHTKYTVTIVWLYAFKVAMDIVANGLRILLALVFLQLVCLFRPLHPGADQPAVVRRDGVRQAGLHASVRDEPAQSCGAIQVLARRARRSLPGNRRSGLALPTGFEPVFQP